MTLVADTQAPDEVLEEARRHFKVEELANLTLGVVTINGFNWMNIAYRTTPGGYQPGVFAATAAKHDR